MPDCVLRAHGSGLNGDIHDTDWATSWLSDSEHGNPPAPSPNPGRGSGQWIHYDLGYQYQLALMHAWNG